MDLVIDKEPKFLAYLKAGRDLFESNVRDKLSQED